MGHITGPLVEETHYTPLGARMLRISSKAAGAPQSYSLYQGKDFDEAFDLDIYDFHARQYDPVTGRFLQVDPMDQFASGFTGMGNNWPNGVDPDGKFLRTISTLGAFAADYLSSALSGNANARQSWNNAKTAISGLENMMQFSIGGNVNTSIRLGISPFDLGIGLSISCSGGNFNGNARVGIGLLSGFYYSGGVGFNDGNFAANIGIGGGNNHFG